MHFFKYLVRVFNELFIYLFDNVVIIYFISRKKKRNTMTFEQEKSEKKIKLCPKKISRSYHCFPLVIFFLIIPFKRNLLPIILIIFLYIELKL